MKRIKLFENFNSSADEFIKTILSEFGLTYEEDIHDDDGNLCIKSSEILDERLGYFLIFASHPDKKYSNYNITFYVNGQIDYNFNTTSDGLKDSIRSCIEELR